MTLHKAFHGFVAVRQDDEGHHFERINMTNLEDYVIFLDEFDFLENDLIGLISSSPQIDNIFRFVQFFYQEMEINKLPLPSYPANASVRRRIEGIVKSLKELQERGIRYPQLNQFTRSIQSTSDKDKEDKKHSAIFRTSHIMTSERLLFRHSERSFHLLHNSTDTEEKTFRLQELVGRVGGISERIIILLKALENTVDTEHLYTEILRQCYGGTEFERQLQQIVHFPRRRKILPFHTRRDALLEHGFSLYDIKDLGQVTDREEVELRHYSIYTTPEYILKDLVEQNLIFALSATADIPRCLHHFDLEWLQHQSDVNWIEVDDQDKANVHHISREKAKARGNTQLRVVELKELSECNYYPKLRELENYINGVSKDPDFGEGQDSQEGHRKRRLERFFSCLLWTLYQKDEVSGISHLLFFNSFRQIKLMVERYGNDKKFFRAIPRSHDKLFSVFEIRFAEQDFLLVFYNAEQARIIRQTSASEAAFDALFHEGKPVFVVTQYLSAGNGVNLQYRASGDSEEKSDFLNLYLLDQPFIYFGNPEKQASTDEKIAVIKENIWYQAKLNAAKYTRDAYFQHILSEVHQPQTWNRQYHKNHSTKPDALLNRIATYIQAIGRIERTWDVLIPYQSLVLSREVYADFRDFLSDDYQYLREEREKLISHNLSQVLKQIEAQIPEFYYARSHAKDSRFALVEYNSREKITQLAHNLPLVRSRQKPELRKTWERLRQDVLSHDFQSKVLKEFDAVYHSPLFEDACIYLTEDDELIPKTRYAPERDKKRDYNAVYRLPVENDTIRKYFAEQGYEMSFRHGSHYFFTPFVYQAILKAAVAEEACKALMRKERLGIDVIPDELFELIDLKLTDRPYYIDCKHYSDGTLAKFSLPEDEAQGKLTQGYLEEKAIKTWETLSQFSATEPKLIYLNFTSWQDAPAEYYDERFYPVERFVDAKIILIRACIQLGKEDGYHPAFKELIQAIKGD